MLCFNYWGRGHGVMSQKGFLIWEIVAKCDHSAQILLSSSNNRYLIELSYDSTLSITKIIEVGVLCYIQCRII